MNACHMCGYLRRLEDNVPWELELIGGCELPEVDAGKRALCVLSH